ncbi:hypothetical protein HZB00_02745 [Candidatus Woesearchaeota archaeon]|nr:hypothetical protein [Candidatus Woesearchaeota archaeon]
MSIFTRKDPICGMKEEKGKGILDNINWFCSASCKKQYAAKQQKTKGCC